ncbi:MAG: hypothetical protein EA347_02710 [Thioalkalivibrio sp.]|nr:MAG: hypothetical protein EA347_02710 [Thioalkalivibrio sp.]
MHEPGGEQRPKKTVTKFPAKVLERRYRSALHQRKERKMHFSLRIGEETTVTNPETGERVTVRLVSGDDGKPTVIVEAAPGRSFRVTASEGVEVIYKDHRTIH